MARVTIDDLWLRQADDGTMPSSAAKKSLAGARDPLKAQVPEKWRTTRFGEGLRWRCRWFVDTDNGKRARTKSFRLYTEAEEYKAAMEDDIRRGRYHNPQENKLFRDAAAEWLGTKLNLKPGTRGRYEREIRAYLNPMWGEVSLKQLRRSDIQEWVTTLTTGDYPADLRNGRTPSPLTPASIRNIVKIIMSGILTYAVEQQWVSVNPVSKVVIPKTVKKIDDMVLFSIEEIEQLAETAADISEQDRLIVLFLAYTGQRVNEVFALQVRDINFNTLRISVRQTWADDGHRKLILGLPKSGHAHKAVFPEFFVEQLREQVRGKHADDWVFSNSSGGHLWADNWRSRVWNRILRHTGMEDSGARIHDLRHTYASIAIANGADVKTLQAQLDHASATITLDTYAALWPERLDEVSAAINSARNRVVTGASA